MEKRLIKKDALAGIAKKMAGDFLVWAPVKKEDNVLFEPLQKDGEPFFAYLNSKNAPKNVFFPHTEALMKFTRTEKGMVFSSDENKADRRFCSACVPVTRTASRFWTSSLTRKNIRMPITSPKDKTRR